MDEDIPRRRAQPQPPLTPVFRGGLTDQVIDQMRTRIADGTWPLQHRLPTETALAKELGVGRSTIREAVRVLAHAGLLEVRQGDGTYVRSRREIDAVLHRRVSEADLLEVYEVRAALEVQAARLAAQYRTDAEAVRLRELLTRRNAAYTANWHDYRQADLALREQIADAAGNALLADLYRGLIKTLRASKAGLDDSELTRDNPDRPEMDELVKAIENRDPQAAVRAAERHADNVMAVLRFLLQIMVTGR